MYKLSVNHKVSHRDRCCPVHCNELRLYLLAAMPQSRVDTIERGGRAQDSQCILRTIRSILRTTSEPLAAMLLQSDMCVHDAVHVLCVRQLLPAGRVAAPLRSPFHQPQFADAWGCHCANTAIRSDTSTPAACERSYVLAPLSGPVSVHCTLGVRSQTPVTERRGAQANSQSDLRGNLDAQLHSS